jgi:hypothetical protein
MGLARHSITKVGEFVEYIKNVAGEKSHNGFMTTNDRSRVVVVRFRLKKGLEEWGSTFMRETDVALGQQSIEQNEFLDAILISDASVLRRPLDDLVVADSNLSNDLQARKLPSQQSMRPSY